ncbi:MAG TPA: phosphotransferase [Vicinamibacterales bacterium]|nr:phosphotransferase [Vicinamibacterales bacterium]
MIDTRIDADLAAKIVRAQFPEIGSDTVRHLGEGCDSVAIEIDGRWVFKFPKRADVDAELVREMRVLPPLARTAPLAMPDYRFRGEPSADFPHHFGGYVKIAGVPAIGVTADGAPVPSWATTIAGFLTWLHTAAIDEAIAQGVEHQTTASLVDELKSDALGDLEAVARIAPDAPLAAWRRFIEDSPPPREDRRRSLVHRDFAAEHVLVDRATRAITGVIDWSEIAVANPAVDLAGLYHWGGARFVDAVLAHYGGPIDDASLATARYLGACRGAADVAFGARMSLREYVDAGLRSLAANAVRTP